MAVTMNRKIAVTEEEIVESLTGVCMLSDAVKQPNARTAARSGLLDLCGLVVALRRRVERLEAQKIPEYRGVWSSDGKYTKGDMATFDGSLWFCKAETTDKPGTGDGWQLCAKRGRDAPARKDK